MIIPGVGVNLNSPRLQLIDEFLQALWSTFSPKIELWNDCLIFVQINLVDTECALILKEYVVERLNRLPDALLFLCNFISCFLCERLTIELGMQLTRFQNSLSVFILVCKFHRLESPLVLRRL